MPSHLILPPQPPHGWSYDAGDIKGEHGPVMFAASNFGAVSNFVDASNFMDASRMESLAGTSTTPASLRAGSIDMPASFLGLSDSRTGTESVLLGQLVDTITLCMRLDLMLVQIVGGNSTRPAELV